MQSACLVAADAGVEGGDLRGFYRCEAIRVAWPMENAPGLDAPTEAMFPDPSQDPWYDLFTSVPLTWVGDSGGNDLKLARPLAVTCYRYDSKDKLGKILGRTLFVKPTPFYPAVQEGLLIKLSSRSSGSRVFHGKDATRILVETPIVSWFVRDAPETWNEAILSGDMCESVEAIVSCESGPRDRVQLTNVFMEFGPLDNPDWYRVREGEADFQQLRGLWLLSHDDHFGLYLIAQRISSGDVTPLLAGPFEYVFDVARSCFWRRDPNKGFAVKVGWDRAADKAFRIGLSVLRFLSPVAKSDPFPLRQTRREDGMYNMTVPVRGSVARLKRVREPISKQYWYLLKDSRTNEPFFPGSEASCLGTLELELSVPWPEIDADYIRRTIPIDPQCVGPGRAQ